ncbi:MAG: PepSY-like domain-containing protein [Rikenellaceae bacterium]|nr:PepSY-like domain-containing protein [Rikenellaceae bacterium]
MRTLFITFLLAIATISTAKADNDRPITFNDLPQKAQQLINDNFKGDRVSYAKKERDLLDVSYEVVLVSGIKIEFIRNGEWREISTRYATVPAQLIPTPISDYISQHHPNLDVIKIEREHKIYEVKLTNGLQLRFDRTFRFIGWDD